MKKIVYLGVALCAALAVTSCKPKESAYKKAYEKAKQQELAQQAAAEKTEPVVADVPVVVKEKAATTVTTPVVRKERVTPQNNASMKEYSVVCGSFLTKSNADALMERMKGAGYAEGCRIGSREGAGKVPDALSRARDHPGAWQAAGKGGLAIRGARTSATSCRINWKNNKKTVYLSNHQNVLPMDR